MCKVAAFAMSNVAAACRRFQSGIAGLAAFTLVLPRVSASLVADGQVHVLTEASFDQTIKEHALVFVEFYAPWCGHCKKLEPEWAKTAELAKELGVLIAKVDAIAEANLATVHNVQSFPTLKLFRASPDVVVSYDGPREAAKMAAWLRARAPGTASPFVVKPGNTAINILMWSRGGGPIPTASGRICVLGLLTGGATDAAVVRMLEDASFMLNPSEVGADIAVGTADLAAAEFPALGLTDISLPAVVVFRDFVDWEDHVLVYKEESPDAVGPFLSWLQTKRLPALIPARRDTEKYFLKDIESGHGLVVLFGGTAQQKAQLHQLAVKFAADDVRLKFIHGETGDEFVEGLGRSVNVNVPGDTPELVVWEFGESEDDDKVYRLSRYAGAFPQEDFLGLTRSFVEAWRVGQLSIESSPETATTTTTTTTTSKAKEKKKKPKKASADPKKPKVVPCPVDADMHACAKWCTDSSAPKLPLVGTLGGKACKDWSPDDPLHEKPRCACYDEAFTDMVIDCEPKCTLKGATPKKSVPGTCAAGDATCEADTRDDDLLADF